MNSTLFEIGPLTLHWYGVMMALGFLAGVGNWIILGRSEGKNSAFCTDLMFWIMLSGIAGARIAYIAEHWDFYAASPVSMLRIDEGGLIYYGGFIGAGIAILLFAKAKGEKLLPLFDFVITAVPLAHAFGRIGCFLNGCCFGRLCDGTVGVTFPKHSPVWNAHLSEGLLTKTQELSLHVHPVQLYETLFNIVLYGVIVWIYVKGNRRGRIFTTYLLAYPVGRFVIETFRGDKAERFAAAGLSIGQLASIGLFLLGIISLICLLFFAQKGKASTKLH